MPFDDSPNYLDIELETAVDGLGHLLERLRNANESGALSDNESILIAVCRALRHVKFVFCDVKDSYGIHYEDGYQRLVDLAVEATNIAALSPFEQVKNSIRRHTDEIQQLLGELKTEEHGATC
jgi:hypothetical protein